jgi:Xaa-Pro aminopeptidase
MKVLSDGTQERAVPATSPLSIGRDEYRERIGRLTALLTRNDIDGALFTAESNITYFSGFRSHAPWMTSARPNFLIVSADGRTAMLGSGFVEPEMRRMSVVDDIRVYGQANGIPIVQIADILREFGIESALGMELGYEQRLDLSYLDIQAMAEMLKPLRLTDISQTIWQLRMIKSPAEIATIRKACDITAAAMQSCFEAARPGISERELGHIAATTMVTNGAERPGFILVTSGDGNYHVMSGKPSDRRLQLGDLLWMDLGAVYNGYWSDFCRTAYLGPPKSELESDQNLILDVNAASLEAIKIGDPVSNAADAAVRAFAKYGIEVKLGQGRIGHGIGLMSTEPPHLATFEQTLCEEGLVFTVEPRFVREHGLFMCEEIIVVTKGGPELLTTAPRQITYIH